MSKFTSSYDVDNRYRFYKSLNPNSDISKERRGVRPGVDDNSRKIFLKAFEWTSASKIYVPRLGLSDGIIKDIHEDLMAKIKK